MTGSVVLIASALYLCLCLIYASDAPSLVMGIDLGTESARAGIFTLDGKLISQSVAPYRTFYPKPGHVEQRPADWLESMRTACKEALEKGGVDAASIKGLAVDTTACSVVFLGQDCEPVSNCILYCDARSAPQTRKIIEKARGDPALAVCNDGLGPISAEWMIPKCINCLSLYTTRF